MKTNRTLLALAMSLLIGATALAQESPSKQINQIKRNNAYLYAEATMENADEALDVARELLMKQVQEYAGTNRKLNQANDVLVKNVNAKCESLSMMRCTMHRMFVYVKKSDIEGVSNATAINTAENTTTVVVEQRTPPVPAPEKPQQAVKEHPVPPIKEQPVETTETVDKQPVEKNAPLSVETVPSPAADSELPTWQQQAIDDLLACGNIGEAKAKLNRMKAEYKLKRYGTPDQCPSAEKSFWIIFGGDGAVSTVLGPGNIERVSYRDLRQSSLDNYKGMEALWFNFAK